jgi:hypothetical protein
MAESAEPLTVQLWSRPVWLERPDDRVFSAHIGRYRLNSRSQAELRAKMSQFPAGTRFRWSLRPDLIAEPWLADAANEMERMLPGLQ